MPIPSPPTDSLYKFAALSGILLVVGALYFPRQLAWELQSKVEELELQRATAIIDQRVLKRRADRVEKIVDTSIATQNGEFKPDAKRLWLTYSDVELKEMLRNLDLAGRDIAVGAATIESLSKESLRYQVRADEVEIASNIGLALGVLLSASGFSLWYLRIQRHQDLALEKRGTTKSIE